MNRFQEQVREFHEKFGLNISDTPRVPWEALRKLRYRLIDEEVAEFKEASEEYDLENTIKELCDLVYVVMGAAISYGIDLEPYFDEVHRSNMSKLWPDGTAHFDAGGKVTKPPTYSKADIHGILESIYGLRLSATGILSEMPTIESVDLHAEGVLDLKDMSPADAEKWLIEWTKVREGLSPEELKQQKLIWIGKFNLSDDEQNGHTEGAL